MELIDQISAMPCGCCITTLFGQIQAERRLFRALSKLAKYPPRLITRGPNLPDETVSRWTQFFRAGRLGHRYREPSRMSRSKSSPPAGPSGRHVVRRRLADGTVRTYQYARGARSDPDGDTIRALPWSAYDGHSIRLRQAKTGAELKIPVRSVRRAELDSWQRECPLTLTFEGRPRRSNTVPPMLPRHLAKIGGFPRGLNIHGLRKLAAANLAQAGCFIHEIAPITAHRTLSMVELYIRSVNQEELAEAAILRLETGGVNGV